MYCHTTGLYAGWGKGRLQGCVSCVCFTVHAHRETKWMHACFFFKSVTSCGRALLCCPLRWWLKGPISTSRMTHIWWLKSAWTSASCKLLQNMLGPWSMWLWVVSIWRFKYKRWIKKKKHKHTRQHWYVGIDLRLQLKCQHKSGNTD